MASFHLRHYRTPSFNTEIFALDLSGNRSVATTFFAKPLASVESVRNHTSILSLIDVSIM